VSRAIALAHETPAGIKQFRRIPYASFETLMYLLKGARGLVFPSLYEGFGLPVLEAMQMDCPVITSNSSSLPEVGGDAVHYVDPFDVHSIAEAIDLFSSDDAYINSLVEKGKLQAERFSPELHYQRIEAAYKRLR
jgi:glycosyltransferase involved in cell wall biosynthesis